MFGRSTSICPLLVLLIICGGVDAWQQGSRRHNTAQPRPVRLMPAFSSVAQRPLLRQTRRDPIANTAPPAHVTSSPTVQNNDYEQHPVPCGQHSECGGGDGYCRQAVGGARCSPCVDYRMHTCDDWGDSIDGNCEVCRMRDTKTDPNHPSEHQLDASQEVYEAEAVVEAIAAPIYGRYDELRSEPSPPTQSGAGRKDFIRQHQHQHPSNGDSKNTIEAPDRPSSGNVLAKLKPPEHKDMQTETSSKQALSSEPDLAPTEQRSPARTWRWFTSTVSEQQWPSDGSSAPISSKVERTLQPDLASGATIERQVLHRVVGDKEVRDTLTVHHEPVEDGGHVSDSASAHLAESGKKVAPQRQMKNIETEEELAAFEEHFSDSSMALRQDQLHQPHRVQDEAPSQTSLLKHCQQRRQRQMQETQSQLPSERESNEAILRLLGQIFRSPLSADGQYDGTNDAMTILRGISAGL